MEVFLLQHVHALGDDEEDVKVIGIYSTRQRADEAVERMHALPGFKDAPDGFCIDRYHLDEDQWTEGYVTTGV